MFSLLLSKWVTNVDKCKATPNNKTKLKELHTRLSYFFFVQCQRLRMSYCCVLSFFYAFPWQTSSVAYLIWCHLSFFEYSSLKARILKSKMLPNRLLCKICFKISWGFLTESVAIGTLFEQQEGCTCIARLCARKHGGFGRLIFFIRFSFNNMLYIRQTVSE